MIELVMGTTTTLVAQTLDGLRCPTDHEDVNNRHGHLPRQVLATETQMLVPDLDQEVQTEYHPLQQKQDYHHHPLQATEMKTRTQSLMLQGVLVTTMEL